MDEAKLVTVIEGIVGTRTYLPIDVNESIIIFERKTYIHVFQGIGSIYGSTAPHSIANKLIKIMVMENRTYHPELLELINGV